MSAPEQSVQPEQAGQDAQHPAQQALAALAEGGVEFDVQALLRSAPASPLSKEAAVLILFGVLDNSPSTGEFEGCPENVSADLDVLLLVRAATLRSHAGQPAFPGGKIDPEDYVLAATTGEPVAYIAALREAVEETGLDPAGVQILGQLHTLPLPISNFMVTPVIGWWNSPCPSKSSTTTSLRSSPACPCVICSTPLTGTPLTSNAAGPHTAPPPSRCICPAARNSSCGDSPRFCWTGSSTRSAGPCPGI